MADDLSEVFNYVSASSQKPSLTNHIYASSAHDERVGEQLEFERQELADHKKFVEQSFEKSDQYLNTIQVGGYAVFFTIWGFSREWIGPLWEVLAAVLMIISASSFIIWEVGKTYLLVNVLRRHASISSGGLQNFLQSRLLRLTEGRSILLSLAQARATVWMVCTTTAMVAVAILVFRLLIYIGKNLWL
ncbi:MAG: hypothetical protein A2061_10185 [Gallionellales bacterium GWA2_59_43]|nr:MAG: hypothetical protein A2061_10185 [Gallionellales bacterium GWA2_59_43]